MQARNPNILVFTFLKLLSIAGIFFFSTSCHQDKEPEKTAFSPPETLLIENKTWKKMQEIPTKLNDSITKYASKNPSMMEGLEGYSMMTVYEFENKYRFYWFKIIDTKIHWVSVLNQNGKYESTTSGMGDPFL